MKTFGQLRLTPNPDGSILFEILSGGKAKASASLPKGPASEAGLQVQAWTAPEMPETTVMPIVSPEIP